MAGAIRFGKPLDTKNRPALMKMAIGPREVGANHELVSDKSCLDRSLRPDSLRVEFYSIRI